MKKCVELNVKLNLTITVEIIIHFTLKSHMRQIDFCNQYLITLKVLRSSEKVGIEFISTYKFKVDTN